MTTVTIKTIAETTGRDGPQWELKVVWPWTVGDNVDTVWIDQKQFSKPALGAQQVVVARKSRKRNKERVEYDGHLDWMWNWNIIEFGVDGPLPPTTVMAPTDNGQVVPTGPSSASYIPPESPPEADYSPPVFKDAVQTRIEIGMAFNQACALIAQHPALAPEDDTDCPEDRIIGWIRELRDQLYHKIIQLPIAPLHYCYEHEQPRVQGKTGAWGHRDDDGWCMEEHPGQQEPEASEEPETKPPVDEEPTQDLPF